MASDYRWNFDPCGKASRHTGPINPSSEHFKGQTKWNTLVREAIQNSLDAALEKNNINKPVKVEFAFDEITKHESKLPNFYTGLKEHIQGCYDVYPNIPMYKNMLEYLTAHQDSIPIIRVSDYNTKGMVYREDDPNSSFYGYLIADGAHVDHGNNDGGGSYGIGKMASFQLSKLHTVIVSTRNSADDVIFQGATILCSHKIGNDKFPGGGFYDCNEGVPVTNEQDIPNALIRNEKGTDILIMGVDNGSENEKDAYDEITKYTLVNFWPAIMHGTLVVAVGNNEISRNNIDAVIREYFSTDIDLDSSYTNPLPYYLAVKGSEGHSEDCRMYGLDDDELGLPKHTQLGNVRLYIRKKKGTIDRIIAARSPRMIVETYRKRSSLGYSAVLICDDDSEEDIGNKLLRLTEPPAHNKWDPNRLEDDPDNYKKAKKCINELKAYIEKCVEHFFASDKGEECEMEGLSELLRSHGEKESKSGRWTTKVVNKYTKIKSIVTSETVKHNTPEGKGEENGEVLSGENPGTEDNPNRDPNTIDSNIETQPQPTTNPKPRPEPPETQPQPTIMPDTPVQPGGEANVEENVAFESRAMAYFVDGRKVIRLVINTDKAVENARIYVYVATAYGQIKKNGGDKANIQQLSWANVNGVACDVIENVINNTSLVSGENKVEFAFPNNNTYKIFVEVKSYNV